MDYITNNKKGVKYIEPTDPRNVLTTDYLSVSASSSSKKYWGTDLDIIEEIQTENQLKHGSCGGQGLTKIMEICYFLKTGKKINYSARYTYVMTDTIYENRNNGGLYITNAFKFAMTYGIVQDSEVEDNNSLSTYDYYDGVKLITDQDKVTKIGGYAFVPQFDLEATKVALDKYGALGLSIKGGKYYKSGKVITGGDGGHFVALVGIKKIGKRHKVYFKNSWGDKWGRDGVGYFYWEDFIEDGGRFYCYTVISQADKKEVKVIKKIVEEKKKANPFVDSRFPNFPIYELVPPAVFTKFGAKSFAFLDTRILAITQAIRNLSGKAVKVNDWKYGGKLRYRGYDDGGFRGLSSKSQHRQGRAIDFSIAGWTSEYTRQFIIKNIVAIFKEADLDIKDFCLWIEADTNGWIHIDLRNDPTKLGQNYYLFNA